MVPSAQLASANPPTQSYAERARKAQNARSSPQVAQQRSTSQNASSSTAGSTTIAAASSAAARPAAHTPPSTASKTSPSSHPVNDARSSTTSHPPPSSSSKVAAPPAADHLAEPRSNGDVNQNGDSAISAPSAAVQKQASAPSVNVWAMRKEQMAARGISQPPANPAFPLPSESSASVLVPSQSSSSPSTLLPSTSGTSSSSKPSLTVPASNGHLVPPSAHDDPFVVRPGRSPPILSPPAIDDAESWPEVGQAAATPPHASNSGPEGKTKEGEEDRGHEREASQGHGARKSTSSLSLSRLFVLVRYTFSTPFSFTHPCLFSHVLVFRTGD